MSGFNSDPSLGDMRAYAENPSLLEQLGMRQQPQQATQESPSLLQFQQNPPPQPAASEASTDAAGQDFSFGDLGLDANTQLLEAILAELRTLNQNIRELT
jgi:hypothetical protein